MRKLVSQCILSSSVILSSLSAVVLDKYHLTLYFLVTAMYPRFLITLNEELNSFPVTVRVGQVSPHCSNSQSQTVDILRIGCRRCRSSRKATDYLRLPDTLDTGAAGDNGTSRAGNRGVHSFRARTGGLCYPPEKPWLREGRQDGTVELLAR